MSVNKYQMFLKTVECGSFSKAAAEMSFTQSAVSHAVQALENELNITLLSRNRGGVVLTADGRALLPRIEKLCAAHHELMQSSAELNGMDAGLSLIHISPSSSRPSASFRYASRASAEVLAAATRMRMS